MPLIITWFLFFSNTILYAWLSQGIYSVQQYLGPMHQISSICSQYASLTVNSEPLLHDYGLFLLYGPPVFALALLLILIPRRPVLDAFMFTGMAAGATLSFRSIEEKRRLLQTVAQEHSRDNEWGFGQVLATFAWLPCCLSILMFVCWVRLTRTFRKCAQLIWFSILSFTDILTGS